MKLRLRFFVLFFFILLLSRVFSVESPRLIFQHSLSNDNANEYVDIENINGQFISDGWKSTSYGSDTGSKLLITFKNRLPQTGAVEWTVKNFDPYHQTDENRQHVALLTSAPDDSQRFYKGGSWLYLRTGTSYKRSDGSCSFRYDTGSNGVDTRFQPHILLGKKWDKNTSYTFRVEYDIFDIRFYINGKLIESNDFEGQQQRFKYLFLSGDPLYRSLVGPEYSDLKVYTTDSEIRFTDKSHTKNLIGLGAEEYSGHGITVGDVNNDGLPDIYVGNAFQGGCRRDILYIQQPDGTFRDETFERGVVDECTSHGVIFFDADNDGDLDLFNANTWEPNQLYINDGNGYFSEESFVRGIEAIDGETRGCVVFDINNDGWQDIFAVNWGMKNEMYINDGTGNFQREYRGAEGKVEDPEIIGTQGVTVSDIDNDGDYDIYISKRGKANELYINQNGQFTEQAAQRNIAVPDRSEGATFADYDNDGDMDLFVANSREPNYEGSMKMYAFRNDGSGYFTDISQEMNMSMEGFTIQLFDADNDADLDFFRLRNTSYSGLACSILDLNDGNGNYDSADYMGLVMTMADARGAVPYDFDQDGDLDMYITTKLFENIYMENETPATENYLQILTSGPAGDYGGVGSKIDVYEDGHMGQSAYLLGHREVTTADGYLSGSGVLQHFGLGSRSFCDVRVTRTDGSIIEEPRVAANQRIQIGFEAPEYNELSYVSGDNQSGYLNQTLNAPLVVHLKDQNGEPVTGMQVQFAVVSGNATVQTPSALTDISGNASTLLTLGSAEGTIKVEARVDGARNSPVTFTAFAERPQIILEKTSGDNQTGQAGKALAHPIVVTAQQSNGQPLVGEQVEFTVTSGGGRMNGETSVTVLTDGQGRAQVNWQMGPALGQQGLKAVYSGFRVDFSATAVAGDPDQLIKLGGDGQTISPGLAFNDPFEVKVTDAYANPVSGQPVEFSVIKGQGYLSNGVSSQTINTDSAGKASVTWIAGPFKTSDNSLHARSFNNGSDITGSPVVWSYSGVGIDPGRSGIEATSPVLADGKTESQITVNLRNSSGVPVPGVKVELSVEGAGCTLTVSDSITDSNGRIQAVLTSIAEGEKIVRAAIPGANLSLNPATVVFMSTQQIAEQLVYVSGDSQQVRVASPVPQPLVVRVLDQYGQPVPNFPITFSITYGDAEFSGSSSRQSRTDANGLASTSVKMGRQAGMVRVEARGDSIAGSPVEFELQARPGDAALLTIINGNDQSGTAGTELPQSLVVKVADVYGNAISDFSVEFSVREGDSHFNGQETETVRTDSSGYGQIKLTLGQEIGPHRVQASIGPVKVIFSINVLAPREPDLKSTITATSPVVPDGLSQSQITVTIRDQHGEPLSGVGVHIQASGSQTVLIQQDSVSDARGEIHARLSATTSGERIIVAYILPENLALNDRATVVFSFGALQFTTLSPSQLSGHVGDTVGPLQVALNSGDQPLFNQNVVFTLEQGHALLNGREQYSVKTDSSGIASVPVTLGVQTGRVRISAVSDLLSTTLYFEVTVLPGAPHQLIKLSGNHQTVRTMSDAPEPLVVAVKDKYNNPVADKAVHFEAVDGGRVLTGQPVQSDSLGRVACRVHVNEQPGEYVFRASCDGLLTLFSLTAQNSNHRPQIISFTPQDTLLDALYGQRYAFSIDSVWDADQDSISYTWLLNGNPLSSLSAFELYLGQSFPNSLTVRCRVTDQRDTLFIAWHLSVSPVFVELESFEAAYNPGSGVTISWSIGSGHQPRSFSVLRSERREGPQQPVKTLSFDSPLKNREFSVIDPLDRPGTYFYWLREVSFTGEQRIFDPAEITVAAPEQFVLEQNIPNPFNPTTRIAFQLPRSTHVNLQIFNQNGQLVRTLANTSYSAGRHTVTWQARNDNGGRVPSGVYFYKIECDEYTRIRKLLLLK